jgi:hypothetical protein
MRGHGGIGRRSGLKIRRSQDCGGSSPPAPIAENPCRNWVPVRRCWLGWPWDRARLEARSAGPPGSRAGRGQPGGGVLGCAVAWSAGLPHSERLAPQTFGMLSVGRWIGLQALKSAASSSSLRPNRRGSACSRFPRGGAPLQRCLPIPAVGEGAGGPVSGGISHAFPHLLLEKLPPKVTRWARSEPVLPPFAIAAGAAGDRGGWRGH